jgi:hypothetical protein
MKLTISVDYFRYFREYAKEAISKLTGVSLEGRELRVDMKARVEREGAASAANADNDGEPQKVRTTCICMHTWCI